MKIESGSVQMNSAHAESQSAVLEMNVKMTSGNEIQRTRIISEVEGLSMSISEEAKKMLDQEKGNQQSQTETRLNTAEIQKNIIPDVRDVLELKRQLLERMIEMLKRLRQAQGKEKNNLLDLRSVPLSINSMFGTASDNTNGTALANAKSAEWNREIKVSAFYKEEEVTAFSTEGAVKTADGRVLNFKIDMEMSRAFMEKAELIHKDTVKIMTDPLVINFDGNVANVSDQKFMFDLDADGTIDEISYLSKSSGFLAYDKNNDGKINDGSELFGTKSGDGFTDLEGYDQDSNGWIDESDDIFHKLKVWMKNDDGTECLVSLKDAGVGAIYLGRAATQYSLNQKETNENLAAIRKTGIYLKENGVAGTIQHVDFAI